MQVAEYMRHDEVRLRRLLKQIGVDHAALRLPEADDDAAELDTERMRAIVADFARDGVSVKVIEPVAPRFELTKLGREGRDAEIRQVLRLIQTMGELGIEVLCYNFMAAFGWLRTDFEIVGRGGARISGYEHEIEQAKGLHPLGPVAEEQLWDSYEYFLRAVLPTAESAGVRLALHPDDPPVSPIRGVARILRSPDAFERVFRLSDSPSHGMTFCQGTFSTMGVDIPATIDRFVDRVAFVHFRDVVGTPTSFVESFHDEGQTDHAAAMSAWMRGGYDGYVRVDHVPTLEGEEQRNPGYETLGRLHAVGYLQGLMEATRPRKT